MSFKISNKRKYPSELSDKSIVGKDAISSLDACTTFSLYLYPETKGQLSIGQEIGRTPNLNKEIVQQIDLFPKYSVN